MELNIKWTAIREINVFGGTFYFVADISKKGNIKAFCIAFKTSEGWQTYEKLPVHFEVTHAYLINKIIHKVEFGAYAIGDGVRVLKSFRNYRAGSVGEVVGKYHATKTWAIKMEDNYIVILEEREFNHYFPKGT